MTKAKTNVDKPQEPIGPDGDDAPTEDRRTTALRFALASGMKTSQNTAQQTWRKRVPPRFADFDYDDIIDEESGVSSEVRRKLGGYAADPDNFLILFGPTGTGKTTAACALISELLAGYIRSGVRMPGTPPRFYSFNDLQRSLSVMDRVSGSHQSVAEATYDSACATSILLLDDVGAGNDSATARQEKLVWDILNTRYNDPAKITVLTTNMPLSHNREGATCLAEWLGTAMWDRVSSEMTSIMFKGESRRGEDDDWDDWDEDDLDDAPDLDDADDWDDENGEDVDD